MRRLPSLSGILLLGVAAFVSPALAQSGARCHGGQSFDQFLTQLKQDAVAAGVSQRAIAAASPGMVYDQGIVNRDSGQRVFGQIFTEFSGRMASEGRRVRGQQLIQTYAQAFARAEKEYGVPPAVITAFWALESDFGAVQGKLPTLRSLVSLAYDCRRSEMFRQETIAALKIIDRGKVLANIEALPPTKYEGAEKREITFPVGPGQTMTLTGQQFLNHSAMPQFFFHCTTAYDILRHKGVELGKRDFLGVA